MTKKPTGHTNADYPTAHDSRGAPSGPAKTATPSPSGNRHAGIAPGLVLLENLLDPQEQLEAVRQIDASLDEWRSDLSRRTQHYGWRYDYKKRVITPDMYLGQLPPWLDAIAQRILEDAVGPETGARLFDRKPEQAIVNEYVGSQGISEHVDAAGFGPAITTVSLISEWDMLFAPRYGAPTTALAMPIGSGVTMTGPSRATWTHQIPRDRDRTPGARRLSVTFRTILNRDGPNVI